MLSRPLCAATQEVARRPTARPARVDLLLSLLAWEPSHEAADIHLPTADIDQAATTPTDKTKANLNISRD